jgi:hypothetical protein
MLDRNFTRMQPFQHDIKINSDHMQYLYIPSKLFGFSNNKPWCASCKRFSKLINSVIIDNYPLIHA